MTNPINYQANVNFADEQLMQAAYTKTATQRAALLPEDVVPVNLDISSAAATALGARPKIAALREAIQVAMPQFDVTLIDQLEGYAFAVIHAQALHRLAGESPDDLPVLAIEGASTRDRLGADAAALEKRGLLKPGVLKEVKGLNGYKNITNDLGILINALRAAWPKIEGKCAVDKSELERAERLAARIVRLVGMREQAPAVMADSADARARAFTLFVNCYDELRRAVSYLRWKEDDVETIAPSLWTGRGHKPSTNDVPAPAAPVTPDPIVAPIAQPSGGTLPGGNPFVQ